MCTHVDAILSDVREHETVHIYTRSLSFINIMLT